MIGGAVKCATRLRDASAARFVNRIPMTASATTDKKAHPERGGSQSWSDQSNICSIMDWGPDSSMDRDSCQAKTMKNKNKNLLKILDKRPRDLLDYYRGESPIYPFSF